MMSLTRCLGELEHRGVERACGLADADVAPLRVAIGGAPAVGKYSVMSKLAARQSIPI